MFKKLLFTFFVICNIFIITAQSIDSGVIIDNTSAYNIVSEDFDKDGDVDFVIGTVWCSSCSANLSYYINDGQNNFTKKIIPKVINAYQDHKVEIADINNDGYKDIVAVDTYKATNWIFDPLNNTFNAPSNAFSVGYSNYHTLADMNGDGMVDLINGSSNGNYIAWWEGIEGSSEFDTTRHYIDNENSSYYSVNVADFNGDGHLDVSTTKETNGAAPYTLSVYVNDGNQQFEEVILHTSSSFGLALNNSDLDADGDVDLIYFDRATGELMVKENPGNGSSTFNSEWNSIILDNSNFVNIRYTYGILPVDIDGDNDIDLIVSDDSSPYKTMLFVNNGNLNFTSIVLGTRINLQNVKDFDGDGDLELLAKTYSTLKLYNFLLPQSSNLSIQVSDSSIYENDLGKYVSTTSSSTAAITFESSATSVATIDSATGSLTIVGPGTTVITATQVSNDSYYSATASISIEVNASSVSNLFTDLNGFWNLAQTSGVKTGVTDHNVIGFKYNGEVYATGVDNQALTDNSIDFHQTIYNALPINQIEYSPGNTTLFQTFGGYLDGNNTATSRTYYENTLGIDLTNPTFSELAEFLTEGKQGLGMRGLANIPANEPLEFKINNLYPQYIEDDIPDILITTIANPANENDFIYFEDSDGSIVSGSHSIKINFSTENFLALYESDRFKVDGSVYPQNELTIRSKAFKLSDFGINTSNYLDIDRLVVHLASGDSDPAFVAYYQPAISVATSLSISEDANSFYYNTVVSPTIHVQLKDANGTAIEQSGILITASIASGSGTLLGNTATTTASGTAVFDQLTISANSDVVLNFSASGLNTVSTTLSLNKYTTVMSSLTDVTKTYSSTIFEISAPTTNNTISDIVYSSSVTSVATIDSSTGSITTTGIGTTVITALQSENTTFTSAASSMTLTVLKAPLSINGVLAQDKEFDGLTSVNLTTDELSYNGLITGDNVTASFTGVFEDANVGTNKTVTLSGTVTGDDVVNYIITYQSSATATITTGSTSPNLTISSTLSRYVSDDNFILIPSSLSSGTITYASSNTSVATVNETTGAVSIIGAGSTTITLTQQAYNQYQSESTTVLLTVYNPTPTIIKQPSPNNQYLQPNAIATTLTVGIENTYGTTYQWYSNSTSSTIGGVLIDGATSSTYTPTTSQVGTTYYYVVVSRVNSVTSTSSGKIVVQDDTLEVSYDFSNADSYSGTGSTLVDLSGNSNRNATLNGTYNFADNALTLQANNSSYIATPQIPFTGTSNQSFTIIAEVTPLSSSGNIVMMTDTNNSSGSGWNTPPIASASNNFYGEVFNNNDLIYSNYTIGEKYTLALVFDYESRSQYFYVNGELVGSQSGISYAASSASNYFFLGQYNSGCCHTFDGVDSGNWYGKFHKFEVYSKGLNKQELISKLDSTSPNLGLADIEKTFNDAAFIPTATSSSTGVIRYTSSNNSVATTSGTTITIVGAGTTVLTATQEAKDNYYSQTVTATLTVNKSPSSIEIKDQSTTVYQSPTVNYGFYVDAGNPNSFSTSNTSVWNDLSLNAYEGTVNNAVYDSDHRALMFAGSGSSNVDLPPILESGENSFSIEAYFKSETDNINAAIFDQNGGYSGGRACLLLTNTGKIGYIGQSYDLKNTVSYVKNQWTHVIITVDGSLSSNQVKIYKNGVLEDQGLSTANKINIGNANGAEIAGRSSDAKEYFKGSIAYVRVYNNTLSQEEVRLNYQSILNSIEKNVGGEVSLTYTSSNTSLISYQSSDTSIATISGTSINLIGEGEVSIYGALDADSNYLSVPFSFKVNVTKNEISLTGLTDLTKTYNDADFELSASSSNTSTIIYSSSNTSVATISGTTVTIVGAGESVITASQVADNNYKATTASITLTVAKDDASITGLTDLIKTYNDAAFELSATSSNTSTIIYSSSNTSVATISGTTVTIVGAGESVITASQVADNNYKATTTSATLTVAKDDASITGLTDLIKTYNDAAFELSTTSSNTSTIIYSSSNTSVATISGTTVTIVGAGTSVITASQLRDANYNSSIATATLIVNKDISTITTKDVVKSYDDADFELDASLVSSTSPGPFYAVSTNTSVATINGTTVSITGGGSTMITIYQGSTSNYTAATASLSLQVNQISSTISFESIEKTYGDSTFELRPITNSTGTINFTSSDSSVATISGSMVTIVGAGSTTINMSQLADADYFENSSLMVLTVAKKKVTVKGIEVADKIYDGTRSATLDLSKLLLEGKLPDDDLTISIVATFVTSDVGTAKTVELSSTYSGEDLSNYTLIDQITAKASITPKSLFLSGARDVNKVYDGTTIIPSTTLGYQKLEGLVSDDNVFIVGKPSFDSKDAGVRSIVQGTLEISGANASNYSLVWTDGSGTISKKPLSVVVRNDAKFVTLEDEVGYRGVSITGFVAGESVEELSGELNISRSNSDTESADQYSKVLIASGYDSSNYELSYLAGNYTIVPADYLLLEVESDDTVYAQTPTYTIKGSYLSSTTSDVVYLSDPTYDEDTKRYTLTDSAGGKVSFEITAANVLNQQSGKPVRPVSKSGFIQSGTYQLEATNIEIESDNFQQEVVTVGDVTIIPKVVVARLQSPIKLYDGGVEVPYKNMSLSGLVQGDDLGANYVGKFTQSDVGTDLSYTLSDIELKGEDKISYVLSSTLFLGADGRINKAPLKVSATELSKTYDAQPIESFAYSFDGFVTGEDENNLEGAAVFNGPATTSKNVGTYTYSLTGFSSSNYQFTYQSSTVSINPKPIQVHGIKVYDKVYDGTTAALVDLNNVNFEGLIEGEQIMINATAVFEEASAGVDKVALITSTYSGDDRINYTISDQLSATAIITKAELNVQVSSEAINFIGVPYTDFRVTYSGFVNNEDITALSGTLKYTGEGATAIDKGVYEVSVEGLRSNNYQLSYLPGTLTIIDGDLDGDGVGDASDNDIDGDGILNEDDADIDGNGVLDNGIDTDEDGINNESDLDDDADGIVDIDDAFPLDPTEWKDTDRDGIGNNMDTDDDNDGQLDTYEILCGSNPLDVSELALDTDGDQIPNCIDDDDDGDGVIDSNDEYPLIAEEWKDTDQDGIGNNGDTDDDNDGMLDVYELSCLSDPLDASDTALDTDGDGIPDCVDEDDDNDGLSDSKELELGTDSLVIDSDNDGVIDRTEYDDGTDPLDVNDLKVNHQTETQGIENWNSLDPDGDTILNQFEIRDISINSRSPEVLVMDTDSDGIYDYLDSDDDGDGLLTKEEHPDPNSDSNPKDAQDTDADELPDYLDADDDNDGTFTLQELAIGTNHLEVDSDKDGVIDTVELIDQTDPLDSCSLNASNQTENHQWWDAQDCDQDGLINSQELGLDTDGDGLENYIDNDDDNDGLITSYENADPNSNGSPEDGFDSDNDGIKDYLEANAYMESLIVMDDIEIYNAMSPNGDGLNDVFVIRNIEKYPNNELIIFNRWGKVVYSQKGYGTYSRFYDGTNVNGETLPVGTYFYTLTVTNDLKQQQFKGYLYINQ